MPQATPQGFVRHSGGAARNCDEPVQALRHGGKEAGKRSAHVEVAMTGACLLCYAFDSVWPSWINKGQSTRNKRLEMHLRMRQQQR